MCLRFWSILCLTTGVECCGARILAPILTGIKVQPLSNEIMDSSCSIGKVRNTIDDLARLACAHLKELKGTDLGRLQRCSYTVRRDLQ